MRWMEQVTPMVSLGLFLLVVAPLDVNSFFHVISGCLQWVHLVLYSN